MKIAHSITLQSCGNPMCRSVHIVLQDENDREFAVAALPVEGIPSFVKELQNYAYEISVERNQ